MVLLIGMGVARFGPGLPPGDLRADEPTIRQASQPASDTEGAIPTTTQADETPLPEWPGLTRRAAIPLWIITAAGLTMIAVAMSVWIIHWGRRLRHKFRPEPDPASSDPTKNADPWVVAGQRLRPGDKPGRRQEGP